MNGIVCPGPLLRLGFREIPKAFKASPSPLRDLPFERPFVPVLRPDIPSELTDSTDISLGRLSIPGRPAGIEPLAYAFMSTLPETE